MVFFFLLLLLQENECLQSCKLLPSCEGAVGGWVSGSPSSQSLALRLETAFFFNYISVSMYC